MGLPLTFKSVLLFARSSSPHTPCATGFLIAGSAASSTFLVTAAHVLASGERFAARPAPLVAIANPPQGPSHSMLLSDHWFADAENDLAVLPLTLWPHLDLQPLPFSCLDPLTSFAFPQAAYTLSPPLASFSSPPLPPLNYSHSRFTPTLRSGRLLALLDGLSSDSLPLPPLYRASLFSSPGHSGAPVFASPSSLLGLIIGRLHSSTLIIPSAHIRALILEAESA